MMFIIGEAIIEDNIAYERFACNLLECKGACCTLPGGRGAPLDDHEVEKILQIFPTVKKYLSEKHLQVIKQNGMVEGEPGSFATVCVDNKACVFVYYVEGIAHCAIEKSFNEGKISWRKPISCHLFPIRILKGNSERLRYERIPECSFGRKQGEMKNLPLYDFVSDALIRKYGEAWYHVFRKECERLENASDLPYNSTL